MWGLLQYRTPSAKLTVRRVSAQILSGNGGGPEGLFPFPEQVALTAPAPPVPTASTKQEHNQDDNQNRFYTHCEFSYGLIQYQTLGFWKTGQN